MGNQVSPETVTDFEVELIILAFITERVIHIQKVYNKSTLCHRLWFFDNESKCRVNGNACTASKTIGHIGVAPPQLTEREQLQCDFDCWARSSSKYCGPS